MSYVKLFSIAMQHSYYANGMGKYMQIKQADNSIQLFTKLGIVMRFEVDSYSFYYDNDKSDLLEELVSDEGERVLLNFKIYSSDRNFPNFTDYGDSRHDNILFFTNNQKVTKDSIYLSKKDFVSERDLLSLTDVEITNSLTSIESLVKPIGVIAIDLAAFKAQFQEPDIADSTINYKLSFQSRKTQWWYYIIAKDPEFAQDISIKDVVGEVTFSEPASVIFPDGKHAQLFKSEQALSLQEQSSLKFQLVNQTQHSQTVKIKHLAVATPFFIEQADEGNASVYKSNIYIYY